MAKAKMLPSGSWRVNLFIGLEKGKRKYKSFTAETRREAEYLAASYAATHKEKSHSEYTIKEAIESYIKSKENILSPSTVAGYHTILDNYYTELPFIKVKDVTQEDIQFDFNIMAVNHSSKTCRNAHGLLSAVLKIYRPEMILRTTLPQKRRKDIYVPDRKEVEMISKLTVGTNMYIPFLLATQCGLRASEISGLDVKDVHPDHIEIKQARVRGQKCDVLKQPKSISGYRKVPIDKRLYKILLSNAQDGRVCPLNSSNISSYWGKFRKKNGLNSDLNFHALRHYYSSECLLLGIPQKYIAELMGHRDTTMIEKVYQHTFPSAMRAYANKLRQCGASFLDATQNATRKASKPHNKAV